MQEQLIVGLVLSVIVGLLCAAIAGAKRRSVPGWFLLGFLIWPALLVIPFLPRQESFALLAGGKPYLPRPEPRTWEWFVGVLFESVMIGFLFSMCARAPRATPEATLILGGLSLLLIMGIGQIFWLRRTWTCSECGEKLGQGKKAENCRTCPRCKTEFYKHLVQAATVQGRAAKVGDVGATESVESSSPVAELSSGGRGGSGAGAPTAQHEHRTVLGSSAEIREENEGSQSNSGIDLDLNEDHLRILHLIDRKSSKEIRTAQVAAKLRIHPTLAEQYLRALHEAGILLVTNEFARWRWYTMSPKGRTLFRKTQR